MSENTLAYNGNSIALDKEGYLLDYTLWEEGLVPLLAEKENIDLTEAHWELIRFVRQFYLDYETSPAIRALVKAMKISFGPEKGNSRYLHRLFPAGPAKQATKLAGLPKPAKCL
ncbi:TusE/DsrC/DsvC family sulfur relay protein [Alteromonas sediminis]|uniref:Sulfurtransferase n=1 Tax=Alteromonas sediminis TaxID=2259342 RepID=A0A3N5ZC79_9ALTE|nr:TusE/DsrC/DsvC family sulfur relay protein [Alteromonas sediminis]RPJ67438.1 TusE/DsrC/DsvC family sulfur relay protein [Alteromonas sediminis]